MPSDPTAYYNDFWTYASYYGEAAARAYYQAWSPPEGTAPPAGVVLPSIPPTTDAADASSTAATGESAATESAGNRANVDSKADSTAAGGDEVMSRFNALFSDSAKAAAWEAYKKQYAEWWEAYGREAGAPREPPQSS